MQTSLWYLKNYPYPMLITPGEDTDRRRMLYPGEVWKEADGQEQAFILTRGFMRIRRWDPSSGMVTVEVLKPGDIVGTLATQQQSAHTEEVVAMEDCGGYVLDRRDVDFRLSTWSFPPITFLRLEGWRLRRYTTHPRDLVFRTLPARIASTLLMQAKQYPGDERKEERTLACSLHPRDLAELTGSSVGQTQQMLEEWQRHGSLERMQGRFTLKNVTGMYALLRSAGSASAA